MAGVALYAGRNCPVKARAGVRVRRLPAALKTPSWLIDSLKPLQISSIDGGGATGG